MIWKGSPNFDSNRKPIDRIVIHWFGVGTLESANARFQNPNNSSAHYGVSGKRVWQWVREEDVAYHAGNYVMNQRSIGIEHDAGIDPPHGLSEESYQTSAKLIADICTRHKIPLDRQHIIGHKEVKPTQCPGTVDINRLISMATDILKPMDEHKKNGIAFLDDYRNKRAQGPEGNWESYARAIVESDKAVEGLKRDVVSFENKLEALELIKEAREQEILTLQKNIKSLETKLEEMAEKPPVNEPTFKNPVAAFFYKLAKFAEG